jgi:multidrug efflux pump subunit AcrA (membrane-fusion protein)
MLKLTQPALKTRAAVAVPFAAIIIATSLLPSGGGRAANPNVSQGLGSVSNASPAEATVDLSPSQLPAIKIQPVESYPFPVEKKGIGSIDFDNKLYFDSNLSVQVFPPQEGKIVKTLAELGDEVQKGEPLYTIATANDPALVVRSPVIGQVTSVNAVSGLFVQPRRPPAPYAVADVSTKWMVGNVPESDSPAFRIGQSVKVTVMAYPGRAFEGKITKIYPTIDASTHRVTIRSEVADPKNELRSGMLAEFVVRVRDAVESIALPVNGVVREPDGTMTTWVTSDRHRFSQRVIKTGLREEGRVQILDGLQQGELAVTDGGIFLSNMLQAPPTD